MTKSPSDPKRYPDLSPHLYQALDELLRSPIETPQSPMVASKSPGSVPRQDLLALIRELQQAIPPVAKSPEQLDDDTAQLLPEFHTLLKQMRQFVASEERNEQLVDAVHNHITDIIEITDQYSRLQYVNRAFERCFGYTLEEVRGKTPGSFLRSGRHPSTHYEEIDAQLNTGQPWKGLLISQDKAGTLRYLTTVIVPIVNEEGDVRNHIAIKRDITDQIQDKGELLSNRKELVRAMDRAEILESANRRLTTLERMKSEFISIVSHELRTPITAVNGALKLLEHQVLGQLNPQLINLISIARRNAERLIHLVNDILDVEKINAGAFTLNEEWHACSDIVQSALESVSAIATQQGVTLQASIESTATAYCDAFRIQQVLINLLHNAISFSKQGDVVALQVVRDTQNNLVRFSVKDQGPGIEENQIPKLFKHFHPLDTSNTRTHQGSGLGLAIAKGIIELHQGQIGVDSVVGVGSIFWFHIKSAPSHQKNNG